MSSRKHYWSDSQTIFCMCIPRIHREGLQYFRIIQSKLRNKLGIEKTIEIGALLQTAEGHVWSGLAIRHKK